MDARANTSAGTQLVGSRQADPGHRRGCGPTFIIAGERRCGTTSLYHSMRGHPDVWLHPKVDMNYFIEDDITEARNWQSGSADSAKWKKSRSSGDYSALFDGSDGHTAVGHKGADLAFWRPAHERITSIAPGVKLIIILRNPVSRAWSHYWNEVGKGREWLSFEEAIANEDARRVSSDYARLHLSYIARGYYAETLEALLRHFPRSDINVLTLENLKSRPADTIRGVYEFLGIDPSLGCDSVGTRENENWTTVPRNWTRHPGARTVESAYMRLMESVIVRTTSAPGTRRRLRKYVSFPFRRPASAIALPDRLRAELTAAYRPQLRRLEELVGRSLDEWAL